MPQNNYNQERQKFKQFRDKLYQSFNYRRDTLMDLVDAISANTTARSPVELSLSALFRREYSALYKGIQEFSRTTPSDSTEADKGQKLPISDRIQTIAELIPTPKQKPFYLWAIDVTPLPRPYAKTLEERTIIYQPNTIKGNKPINIGHSYSVLTALPEQEETGHIPWAIPLMRPLAKVLIKRLGKTRRTRRTRKTSQKFSTLSTLSPHSPLSYPSFEFIYARGLW